MIIPEGFKLVPVEPAEEMIYWIATAAHRGDSGKDIWAEALDYTPAPPQPIYDEAKRIAELERALAGMLFAFDDGVGLEWSEDLLDFARKLTSAKEFKAALKPAEGGGDDS